MLFQRHREIEPSYNLDLDLLEHFRWRATRSGESISKGFGDQPGLISAPFVSYASKWRGKATFVLFSTIFLFMTASKIRSLQSCGLSSCQTLENVTAVKVVGYISSDGQSSSISTAITAVELMHRGCSTFTQDVSKHGLYWFPEQTTLDAFSIHFNRSFLHNNIFFNVEAISNGGNTSSVIGASGMLWADDGVRMLDREIACPERFDFAFTPPWQLLISSGSAVEVTLLATGLLLACLASLRRPIWANWVVVAVLILAALLNFAATVGAALERSAQNLVLSCSMTFGYAAFAAVTALAPCRFPEAALALGLLDTAATVLDSCATARDCAALVRGPPIVGMVLCCIAGLLEWARCRHVAGVAGRALPLRRRAEYAWAAVLASGDSSAALRRLEAFLRSEPLALLADCPCRQLNRQRPDPPAPASASAIAAAASSPPRGDPAAAARRWLPRRPASRRPSEEWSGARQLVLRGESLQHDRVPETVPSTQDPGRPVASLDQLYSQVRTRRSRGGGFGRARGRSRRGTVPGRGREGGRELDEAEGRKRETASGS